MGEWEPEDTAWMQYANFEQRCKEVEKARRVMERYVNCRPTQQAFLRLCKFEEKHSNMARARSGFEKGIELLSAELDEKFYIKFAQFEQRQKEMERAQAIFKLALDVLPKGASDDLYRAYVSFEELQTGDIAKARAVYDGIVKVVPHKQFSFA